MAATAQLTKGILNSSRLEQLLASLLSRVDEQQQRIAALEQELAGRPSREAFATFERRMHELLAGIDGRFEQLSGALGAMDRNGSLYAQANGAQLGAALQQLGGKLDGDEFEAFADKLREDVHSRLSAMETGKAPRAGFEALQRSQTDVVQEMVAVQKLLSCKVDRVELPLLKMAAQSVDELLAFRGDATPRLRALEEAVEQQGAALEGKVDESALVQRVQNLHEHLMNKVDRSWAERHLEAPFAELSAKVAKYADVSQFGHESVGKMRREHDEFAALVQRCAATVEQNDRRAQELERQFDQTQRLSSAQTDTMSQQLRDAVERFHADVESGEKARKIVAAHIADVRQQMLDLKRYQEGIDAKVGVSLRFVDWYTDVHPTLPLAPSH